MGRVSVSWGWFGSPAPTMAMMTTTRPPSFPPRVLEHQDPQAPEQSPDRGWHLPEQSVRGLLAGVEASIGSWLVVTVLTVAGYVATAAAPALGSATWIDAARVGSGLWLLGHGGVVETGGATISVIPLGITMIAAASTANSVRRARLSNLWGIAAAGTSYVALVAGCAAFAGYASAWWALVGAPLVVATGVAWAIRKEPPEPIAGWLAMIPAPVQLGVATGLRVAAAYLALGTAVVLVAVGIGFAQVAEVHRALVPDVMSSVLILLAQILLLPTLSVWGSSYLAGPGFAVGEGTRFSLTQIDAGPLPVVPVLGALPEPGSEHAAMASLIGLGVLVGVGCGIWLRRRHPDRIGATAITAAVTVVVAAALVGLLAWASSGAVGPGRMAQVGPEPVPMVLAAGWQLLLGLGVAAVLTHPGLAQELGRVRDRAVAKFQELRR